VTRAVPSDQGGFILPLAILLLPAFLALAFAAFTLAHGEWAMIRLDGRLVEELASAHPPAAVLPAPGEQVVPLGHGFLLLQSPPGPLGGPRRGHRVGWMPDPPRLAGTWSRDPEGPPELGPIPLSGLLAGLAIQGWGDGGGDWLLPTGHRVQAPEGRLLATEEGAFLVVASGDIRVTGLGPAPGLLLAQGDVLLLGGVEWVGGIRAHGSLRGDPDATVLPDSSVLHTVLSHPALARIHLLPGGERLGRH
jgi:hypothetical protein